jgi:competence protein ComEA
MMRKWVVMGALLLSASTGFAQEDRAGAAPAAPAASPAPPPPPPGAGGGGGAKAVPPSAEPKKGAKTALMDINTATVDELKTLPGVDDALAQKIVAGRPYKGKDELFKKKLMDKNGYDKVRPLVVAKQPKAEKPAEKPAK